MSPNKNAHSSLRHMGHSPRYFTYYRIIQTYIKIYKYGNCISIFSDHNAMKEVNI